MARLVAREFFGAGIRALQVVYADDRGQWPWDVRYRGGRGGQPVLGSGQACGRRADAAVTA